MTTNLCPTCDNPAVPTNFGGQCDSCTEARKARLGRVAKILAAHGQSDTQFGQALAFHGYKG